MTVRTTQEITFGQNDFKRTDRGVTWGIKVTQVPEATFVSVFVQEGIRWSIAAMLDDALDLNISEYPNMQEWMQRKCLVALNAWLKSKFPPLDQPPPSLSRAELADAMIQTIRITVNAADGTLTAAA